MARKISLTPTTAPNALTAMLESQIQRNIIRRYEAQGYLVVKLSITNKPGFPDLMCLKDGKAVFIEVKRPGEKPRPLQRYRLEELTELGFEASVMSE